MKRHRSIDEAVAKVAAGTVCLAEAIRNDPELSGSEFRAAARCVSVLCEHGFEIDERAGGLPTAFVASRRFGSGRVRVAFLAEYDALPGIGHGCGHHLIAASAVGAGLAAALIATDADDLELQVIGTPSEETIGGKVVLAEAGVFDGLDGALMFHAGHEWRTFTDSLACQSVEVLFGGKSAHAVASPEAGVNALDAMIDLFMAVRALRGRFSREVRIPGVILEGGSRANIVPDRAVARFSVRAPSAEERERVVTSLISIVEEIGKDQGCRTLVRPVDNPYDEMSTNVSLATILREELLARGRVTNDAPRRGKGSLDAGNLSRRAPAVHAYLPAAPPSLALHTREFGEAAAGPACEEALMTASAAMAATALRLAHDAEILARVREEFHAMPRPALPRRWPLLTREPEARVDGP